MGPGRHSSLASQRIVPVHLRTPAVSLLLCDVDHFKQFNDVYGHRWAMTFSRRYLRVFWVQFVRMTPLAAMAEKSSRLCWVAATANISKTAVNKVRIAVNGSPFFTKHGSISVSVSVGATTVRGWNRSPHFETLLKRADKALYQAKAAGLNQVNFAETPVKA
jgi:PleD family two-component response regulator